MRPTAAQIERVVATIAGTKYFPTNDVQLRFDLMELLAEMVGTIDQLEWLRKTFRDRVSEWPGLAEVRAIFTCRFRPADGIAGKGHSTVPGFTPGDIESRSMHRDTPAYLPAPDDEPIGELATQIKSVGLKKRL